MRDLAYIAKIEKLEPIKDKDRIELATVANWEVIVGKGEYKVGDLVVYVEYDTVLPVKPEFEFLRKRCYSKLYDGFRIRNMSMAGVFSQGIVFPLSILPKSVKIEEGRNVAKELEIVRYDPEEIRENRMIHNSKPKNPLMRFKWFRKLRNKYFGKTSSYPSTVKKSDETNIQKLFNAYKENYNDVKFYATEKVEGQAATYVLKRGRFHVYSHNKSVRNDGKNNWSATAKLYDIEKKLRQYKRKHGVELAIQGEIAGPGIQKNIYGFDTFRFFVYKITNVKTGEAYNFVDLVNLIVKLDLFLCPLVYTSIYLNAFETVQEILEHSNGDSVLRKDKKIPREGLVWRAVEDQNIGFKAKSPVYLAAWDKKDKTE